jgi:hypothetical protein
MYAKHIPMALCGAGDPLQAPQVFIRGDKVWDGYSKLTYVWELCGFYSWFHVGIFLNEIVRCHHCIATLLTVLC